PRLVGTGFEDYIGEAWNLRLVSNLHAGVTIREPHAEDARHTCYRWHIQDPITFKKSLKVELERRSFITVKDPETGEAVRGDFKYRPDLCSSVAYWYQRTVATSTTPFPTVEERLPPEIWVVPRDMVASEMKDGKSPLKTSPGLNPINKNNKMGWVHFARRIFHAENDKVGAWFEVPFKVSAEGRYSISVFQILFREYGIWKLTLLGPDTEKVLAERLDFWNPYITRLEYTPEASIYGTNHEAKVGICDLKPGDYVFRFECIGSHPLSFNERTGTNGLGIGIDGISLRKLPWGDMHAWYKDYLVREKAHNEKQATEARRVVAELDKAIKAYKKDLGHYPEALEALLERPAELNMSSGTRIGHWPYFKGGRIPLDPWGQRYRYAAPGRYNPDSFDVWSVRGESRQLDRWIGNWDAAE
ncbi:MAG: DUF2961 domain-containing protein, partial [Pirellulaceae bacterium]|nr:DUF2961 domain-containing protein [Pirellulaceae bacterium]